MSKQFLRYDRDLTVFVLRTANDLPIYFRNIFRYPSIDLAVEFFDDLRATFTPPGFCVLHLLPILQSQWIWKVWIRISFCFVIVWLIGWIVTSWVCPRSQLTNIEQVHQSLVILLRG